MRIKELHRKIAFIRQHVDRYRGAVGLCLELCKNRSGSQGIEEKLANLTARMDSILAILDQIERDHSRPRTWWERILGGGQAQKGTLSLICTQFDKLSDIGNEILDQSRVLHRLPWRIGGGRGSRITIG